MKVPGEHLIFRETIFIRKSLQNLLFDINLVISQEKDARLDTTMCVQALYNLHTREKKGARLRELVSHGQGGGGVHSK